MQFRLRRAFNQDRNTSGGIPPLIIVRIHPSVRRDLELGRHALLCYHRDGPAHGIAGLMLLYLYRTDHPRHRQSVQHHSRLLAPILGEAATSGLYRISNIDSLHASPIVAVYAKQFRDDLHDIEQPLTMIPNRRFASWSIVTTHSNHPARRRTFATRSHRGSRRSPDRQCD